MNIEMTENNDANDCLSIEPNGAYFPISYYTDFISYVVSRPEKYKFITYDDLCWSEAESYPNEYKKEFIRWWAKNAHDRRIKILLQHDVDSRPNRTLSMLRSERDLGAKSSSMIFSKRIDRRLLKKNGKIKETEYNLDHDFLRELVTKHDFIIGYHSNVVERSNGDNVLAKKLFTQDIQSLREIYNIKYFSPHGGVPTSDGRNNSSFLTPPEFRDLIWVHNRFSPSFSKTYSDGGINNPKYDPNSRDLISFVKNMTAGKRYRILIHPQYFHSQFSLAKVLAGTEWYDKMVNHYCDRPHLSFWEQELG